MQKRAITDKIMAYEVGLIQQYLTKGYTEDQESITDDDGRRIRAGSQKQGVNNLQELTVCPASRVAAAA